MKDTEVLIREIAKSNKYQTLFSFFKESGINFFNNDCEYTELQIVFINYLSFYSSLFTEIAIGTVDDIVLECTIYEDAFMYWNRQKSKKETEKMVKETNEINRKKEIDSQKQISWIFKSKRNET